MLLLQSILLLLLPLWSISTLASVIPQTQSNRDLLGEQKAIAASQAPLSTPTSTIDSAIENSGLPQIPDSEHKNPIRNGDPYGLSDFGIDPAHVTPEQMQSLREAGMIRNLDEEESSDKWNHLLSIESIESWPLLKLGLLGATAIAVIKAMLHFKTR